MSGHGTGGGERGDTRDDLTAAMRRTHFIAALHAAKDAADRDLTGLVLCLLDVDQLRNVNDRHGQAAGDAALRALASRAAGSSRCRAGVLWKAWSRVSTATACY